jgi:hypothetical protein
LLKYDMVCPPHAGRPPPGNATMSGPEGAIGRR